MLTKVQLIDERGVTLDIPMDVFEDNSPYAIKNIDGLGPVKSQIASSPFALLDGEAYLSHRGEMRNIVLTLGFSPHYEGNETVQALRNVLYEFAMTGKELELLFFSTDLEIVKIKGRVETNEPVMFSEDPENQISILCMRPTSFQSLQTTVVHGIVNQPFTINYPGSKNTGVKLTIQINGVTQGASFQRLSAPVEILTYQDQDLDLASGDIIRFSTVRGSKSATLTRYGASNSILGKLSSDSVWVELRPGANELLVSSGLDNAEFTLEYTATYGAV